MAGTRAPFSPSPRCSSFTPSAGSWIESAIAPKRRFGTAAQNSASQLFEARTQAR